MINNFKAEVTITPAEEDYNANIRYHDENNSDLEVFLKSHLPFNDTDVTYLYDNHYSDSYPLVSFSHSTAPIGYQFENTGMTYKFSVKENGLQDIWWHDLNNSYVINTSKLSGIPLYYIDLYGLTINSNNQSISVETDLSLLSHMGINHAKINLANCTILNGKNFLSNKVGEEIEIINANNLTLSAASGYDMSNFLKDSNNIYGNLDLSGITFEQDSQDNYYNFDKLNYMFDNSGNETNPIGLNISGWNGYITGGTNCDLGLNNAYYNDINASGWDLNLDGADINISISAYGNMIDFSNMNILNSNTDSDIRFDINFYDEPENALFNISDAVISGDVDIYIDSSNYIDLNMSGWTIQNSTNGLSVDVSSGQNVNMTNWTIQNITDDNSYIFITTFAWDALDMSDMSLSNCVCDRLVGEIAVSETFNMSNLICDGVTCGRGLFGDCNASDIDFSGWNLIDITNDGASSYGLINSFDSSNIDFSNLRMNTIQNLLYECQIDDTLNLSNFDGYDWGAHFSGNTKAFIEGCTIETLDVSDWTNIGEYLCGFIGGLYSDTGYHSSCGTITGLDTWDVSNVVDFSYFIRIDYGTIDLSDISAWRNMILPIATFDHMLPNREYISAYPGLNGWFDIYGTFYPYLGTVEEFEEITFKNIIDNLSTVVNPEFGDCYNVRGSDSGGNFSAIQAWDGTEFILITKIYDSEQPGDEALYDWDFTTSLQDTNGVDVEFFSDSDVPTSITTTPATGQYIQGTGLSMESKYPLHIPVDMFSKTTSYRVEIDFASCTLNWASWNSGFICNISTRYDINGIVSGLNSDFGAFTVDSYDGNSNFHSSESSITTTTFFANSTMKIINRLTNNNNVVWDFYKGDSLVFTTDEYQSDGITPVFWDNSSLQLPFAISGNGQEFAGIITGMRIYEES